MKAITAIICSAVLCLGSLGNFPLNESCRMNAAAADQTGEAEERIYRTSVEGKCEGIDAEKLKWDFVFTLTAYNNGHIYIDVQCKNVNSSQTCNEIGNIVFDDSMIAAVGEKGYAGTSSFKNHHSYSKYLTSFSESNTIYTAIFSDYSSGLSGSTLMSFDLFVKEAYLQTNQKMVLFGKEIEIPFGNPPVDKDTMIAQLQEELDKYKNGNAATEELKKQIQELEKQKQELEQQNQELKSDNEALKRTISILTKNKFCDVNQDGIVDVEDAQLVLMYYTETIAGLVKDEPIEDWYAKRNTI